MPFVDFDSSIPIPLHAKAFEDVLPSMAAHLASKSLS